MKKPKLISISATFVLGLGLCVGCGEKADSLDVAPPVPPAAGVSLAPAPSSAPAPGPGAPGDVTSPPPDQLAANATNDIYKGLSPQQIEDLKAGTTLETHDLNLDPLNEAVTGFAAEFRRIPTSQEEMVKARYLPRVLHAPKGKRYVINQESGEVTVE
jgi:hypothetical protein